MTDQYREEFEVANFATNIWYENLSYNDLRLLRDSPTEAQLKDVFYKGWQAARDHYAPKLEVAFIALTKVVKEEEKDFLGDRDDWIECAQNMKGIAQDTLTTLRAAGVRFREEA